MTRTKANILIIDDDKDFQRDLRSQFDQFFRMIACYSKAGALKTIQVAQFDLILLDLFIDKKDEPDGLALINRLKRKLPHVPLIIVTVDKSSKNTVQALRLGADDYIRKDEFDFVKGKRLIEKYLNANVAQKNTEKKESINMERAFIGEDAAIIKLKRKLIRLSQRPNVTILLTGESGVGKEVAARYLHSYGARANFPFEAVNLSAISENLMESQLFGHKRGAFTDAKSDRIGIFEKANTGILFLDEIGEINFDIQVKLLRFLDDKVIEPIGGNKIKLNIQIVTATNKNLLEEVKKGTFRLDLYHRLNQYSITIPPLRERKGDIKLLIQHFLEKEDYDESVFSAEAYRHLINYAYPGNIRELSNIIVQLCTDLFIEEWDEIELKHLYERLSTHQLPHTSTTITPINTSSSSTVDKLDWKSQEIFAVLKPIEEALIKNKGKKGAAAQELNMSMDNMRYRVEKNAKTNIEIFEHFPEICRKYKSIINEHK